MKRELVLSTLLATTLACEPGGDCIYSVDITGSLVGGCGEQGPQSEPEDEPPLLADGCLESASLFNTDFGDLEATTSRLAGRYYIEAYVDVIDAAWQGFGIAESGMDLLGGGLRCMYDAGGLIECGEPGSAFDGPNGELPLFDQWEPGDTLHMAVDLDEGKVWFGQNGNWLRGDPTAGTGAFELPPNPGCRALRPVAFLFEDDEVEFNLGRDAFEFAAPEGFAQGFGNGCFEEVCPYELSIPESCDVVDDPQDVTLGYPASVPSSGCSEASSYTNDVIRDTCYDEELHVIGVYEGDGRQPGVTVVEVAASDKPIRLALYSYEGVQWVIDAAPGAEISGITAIGYDLPSVDAPEGVTVDARSSFDVDVAFSWEEDTNFAEFITDVRAREGMMESSFYGCYNPSGIVLNE